MLVLAWFHLQAKAGTIPNMKRMITERWMRFRFRLHLAVCMLVLATALCRAAFTVAAGLALALSTILLWVNLFAVVRQDTRHGDRITW